MKRHQTTELPARVTAELRDRWLQHNGAMLRPTGSVRQDRWGVYSQIRLAKGDSMSASARKRQNFWVSAK